MQAHDYRQTHEEIHTCVGCASSDISDVASALAGDSLYTRVSVCRDCGLIFRSYRLKLAETERRSHVSSQELTTALNSGEHDVHEQRRCRRYERNRKWIEAHRQPTGKDSVLDIACGPGTGLLQFKNAGYLACGIDISPARSRYASETLGINAYNGAFESYDFGETKFDVVVCSHFLEHSHFPLSILKKIRKMLTETGILYIEVPNHFNYSSFSDAIYLVHNNSFTSLSLGNILRAAGFAVLSEHEPRTRFDPGSTRHLGIVAKPSESMIPAPSRPDNEYLRRVRDCYLKGLPPGDSAVAGTSVNTIEYRFRDKNQIEQLLHKAIMPVKLTLSDHKKIIARMYYKSHFRAQLNQRTAGLKTFLRKSPHLVMLYHYLKGLISR